MIPSKKHEEIEPKKRKQKAFTLMEMVVVVAIIAVLVLLISPNLWTQKESATKKADEAFMTTLQTQVELYRSDNDKAPADFAEMKDKNYLTAKQLKQINDKKITLADVTDAK